MAYSSDHDIKDLRPDILNLGQGDWSHLHDEAKILIDRDLKVQWYREAATTSFDDLDIVGFRHFRLDLFDPDLFLEAATQFVRLSSYKTLELIYQSREKDMVNDPFADQKKRWQERYKEELKNLIVSGISYDWNKDGNISVTEKAVRILSRYRLKRIYP